MFNFSGETTYLLFLVASIVEDLMKLKLDPDLEREIQFFKICYILCSGFLLTCGTSFLARILYKFSRRRSSREYIPARKNTNLTFF